MKNSILKYRTVSALFIVGIITVYILLFNSETILEENTIESNSKSIKAANNTVFIGDSYGDVNNSWIEKVAQKMDLVVNKSYWKFTKKGAGFTRINNTFLMLLQSKEIEIKDKSSIKNIFVCGRTKRYPC